MENNKYTDFIRMSREQFGGKSLLNDDDLDKVSGGVGGENEATCPECGKTMKPTGNEYGDSMWYCSKCKIYQICSDADYILMIKAMEAANQPGIVYPVWWDQVKH